MNRSLIMLIFVSVFTLHPTEHPTLHFNKVVIWGHKLHSHTHSYIHWAFYRAFQELGYETHWLDNSDNISSLDLSKTLFIAEGQVDQKIPIRDDGFYITHNCSMDKYKKLFDQNRCIILQVYTHDCLPRRVEKVSPCIYYDFYERVTYMPWATDLLPREINAVKAALPAVQKQRIASFIGSIWGGEFGNIDQVNQFKKACMEQGIAFRQLTSCSMEENIALTKQSYIAPAIQGAWQIKNGYIPCRIFKNISYGQMGVTNSATVWKLFNKRIVYNSDTYQLFYDAQQRLATLTQEELFELMDFVRDNHTYINRINTLLIFLEQIFLQKYATI